MNLTKAFSPSMVITDLSSLSKTQVGFLLTLLITMSGLSYYWQAGVIETMAGITGVTCVFLVNMKKLSNFLFGFINCLLYGYVAYQASYYGDTMLNWMFYLPIQLIGAYYWAKSMEGGEVVSRKITSVKVLSTLAVVTMLTVFAYSTLLSLIGGSLSTVDATTTTLSVLATYFMVKGYREQWVCWIIVNILSIFMWVQSYLIDGEGISVLIMWVMFLVNSVYGCYTWFKSTKGENNE